MNLNRYSSQNTSEVHMKDLNDFSFSQSFSKQVWCQNPQIFNFNWSYPVAKLIGMLHWRWKMLSFGGAPKARETSESGGHYYFLHSKTVLHRLVRFIGYAQNEYVGIQNSRFVIPKIQLAFFLSHCRIK